VGGTERDSQAVTLNSGETSSVNLSWSTVVGDNGDYAVTVASEDASDSTSVTVETGGPSTCGGTFTDSRDSQTYETVEIGTQCWMAENLNIGTRIDVANNQTDNGIIEKYCYNDNNSNCDIYGGLYQWNESMQYVTDEPNQGICPQDWRIPTDAEWHTLENYLTADGNSCNPSRSAYGCSPAGGALKGGGDWIMQTCGSTACNSSGFTGLPGGAYFNNISSFDTINYLAGFWTSSNFFGSSPYMRSIEATFSTVFRSMTDPQDSYSIRCIKK
jgi:uncharacterized protein (TIGR02145 family)